MDKIATFINKNYTSYLYIDRESGTFELEVNKKESGTLRRMLGMKRDNIPDLIAYLFIQVYETIENAESMGEYEMSSLQWKMTWQN